MRRQSGSMCVRSSIFRVVTTALAALALLCWFAPQAAGQRSARVVHRNLPDLVKDADTIVLGKVLSVTTEPHPQYQGLMTLVVQLEVIDMMKGKSGAPFTFRQYLWDAGDISSQLGYKPGQEFLLFMLKPHSQTGLSSPAGLEQGRFRITRDAQGNRIVANSLDNAALMRGVDPKDARLQSLDSQARTLITKQQAGPIRYDQLKSIVQALAGN